MEKICLVIPSLGPGGMERVMSILAGYFDCKKGAEVHLIIYGKRRELFFSIPETVVVHKPDFKFDNSKRTWHTIKTIYFLRRCIQTIKPQTLLSFGEYWNNLFLLSTIGLNIPKYIADRAEPGLKKVGYHELLSKLLYPFASGIIVQTNVAKKIYENKYRRADITAIGNPIKKLEPGKEEKKENVILSVGRLVNTKNFDLLIKIFHQLNMPDWKLYILGGDSQKQNVMNNLKKLINELHLEDRVILKGTVSNVEEYYQKSKIFAFTSSSEGFPNALGEAMSAGLPIVTFDCVAGPAELIDDGQNGFLVPLYDEDKFENKLRSLIEDEELRQKMGKASMGKIGNFSVDVIGEKFYSILIETS